MPNLSIPARVVKVLRPLQLGIPLAREAWALQRFKLDTGFFDICLYITVPIWIVVRLRCCKSFHNQEFAQCIAELVDVHCPQAEKIRVVLDNLSTHTPAALYEVFPPADARRMLRKLEFHLTPVHGSWLNMAAIELAVLARHCLNRRVPDVHTMGREVAAWEASRNRQQASIDWRFTTKDARIKLKSLYPKESE